MQMFDLLSLDWRRLEEYRGRSRPLGIFSFFDFRFIPVCLIRFSHAAYKVKLGFFAKFFSLLNFMLFGIEVSSRTRIDGGLVILHSQGIVIGAFEIGKNCTIFQQVTLGAKLPDFDHSANLRPTLGNDVFIGAGVKVIGGIKIGNDVKIGANCVIVKDIVSNCTVVTSPIRIIA
jgi:serine O-acetyltransferase